MNRAPKGVYAVGAVFFFLGMVCIADLLPAILYLFGVRGWSLWSEPRYEWIVVCGLLLFWLLCYGVVALLRLRRSAQLVFFAMTLWVAFRFLTVPATNSYLYSPRQIIVFRIVLMLPLVASCVYLLRLRFAPQNQQIG